MGDGSSVGVSVGVGSSVGVSLGTGVSVGVSVGVGSSVGAGSAVGVSVGAGVSVGSGPCFSGAANPYRPPSWRSARTGREGARANPPPGGVVDVRASVSGVRH